MCRVLVSKAKSIVVDEPIGNLDSKNYHELLSLLKKLNNKKRVMIMMVTHNSMIVSYSIKLLYIKDGKLIKSLNVNK